MKNLTSVLVVFAFVILVGGIALFSGCEGEQGPTGPTGNSGVATCGTCHNVSTSVLAKQAQYQASVHATGGHSERASSATCAVCHSSEGFTLAIAGETVTGIDNPTQPNCRTCHNIHTNYDETDYNLTVSGPVEITSSIFNEMETIDIGKGNLCASCHRAMPSGYELAVGGGDFEVTSTRFGPHHGPQSNSLVGWGAYEIAGSEPYTNSSHTTMIEDGCVTCHMAKAYGTQAGGHSMNTSYDDHGEQAPNVAGCESCHADIESFDINGLQTEIKTLFEELETKLIELGLITDTGSAVKGTYTSDKAGAIYNYKWVEEDRSDGIHNPKYIKALLKNSIEAL